MDLASVRTIQRAALMGVVGAFVDSFCQSDMWYNAQQEPDGETEEQGAGSKCSFRLGRSSGLLKVSWFFMFKEPRLGYMHIIADYQHVRLISWHRGAFTRPGQSESEVPYAGFNIAENDEPIEETLFGELLEATRRELYRYLRRHKIPTYNPARAILGPQKT